MSKEFKEILSSFRKTWSLVSQPERVSLIVASILMAIAGTLTNLPAVILGHLVDNLVSQPNIKFSIALPFLGLIVVIILIRETLTVIRKYLIENVATQTDKKTTVTLISHLLKTDLSFLSSNQVGSLNGKIYRSVQGLVKLIKLTFLEFAPSLFSALAAIGIALFQKPLLASVMVLVIPTGLFIIVKQISSQKGIRVMLLRGKEKIDGTVVETLGGIETVRALNTADLETQKVETVAEELRAKEIKHHIIMALFDSIKYLNEGFFYILVISLSIFLAAQGTISRGDILVYSILFTSILNPLRDIHRILDQAHESSINVNDLFELLNEPIDPSFQTSNHLNPPLNDTVVEIRNLSFSYNHNPSGILKDLNLTIKKGEKIGIAGSSGCGKTTLIKILLRLIHNYDGDVKLFGQDLKLVSRELITDKIAYVPQKTYIFSGTIRENIIYGCARKTTDQEILEAVKKANIYDEIQKDLGGLKGKVSENGNNLSGGQRQRLALARLILKSPEILIFDEATSALDNTNEAKIQRNIEEMFADKTTLTIAHRLTTLKNSDRILVFDQGKIVQEGKYDKLSVKKGFFQDFLNQKPV